MEEVIKKIIQIEEEAQAIIDETMKEKERKEKEHEEELVHLQASIIQNAHRKVEQIRKREFDEVNSKTANMEKKCEDRLQRIEKNADMKMDGWIDELVNRVLD